MVDSSLNTKNTNITGNTEKTSRTYTSNELNETIETNTQTNGSNETNESNKMEQMSAAWLRVADQTKLLSEGQCVVFDDSFQHEAGNLSTTAPRIVLIIDVWHPDFSDEEVRERE